MLNIEHKVIAITGASSGIGEAAARFLAAKGAKVVLGARRIENLKSIAAEIQAAGGEVRFTTLDATQSATKHAVRVVSEGLRQEVGSNIRVTVIAPGATESELPNTISDPEMKKAAIIQG
jgi:NADP-dependent 3-hydroxy acid dehydrogenase YdfG